MPIGPGTTRVSLGVASLVVSAILAASLATQISDQVIHGAFQPDHYFSYFSIQTSLANLVALVASGIFQLQSAYDTVTLAVVRHGLVAYSVVTGVVYNLLLRDLPVAPGDFVSEITFPNDVIHVVVPGFLVLDWLVNPHRPRLPMWSVPVGLIYPMVWVIETMLRGRFTGWYPYGFLNPSEPAGWNGVWFHIGAIAVAFVSLLLVAVGTNRVWARILSR